MPDPTDPRAVADDPSGIVQQMPKASDEVLSELRPCPFCGASARVFRDALPLYPIWWVECSRRPIPHHTTAFRSEREALDDWNRRATEADLRAEVERLQAGLRITAAVLQAERARRAGKPFSGSWSIPNCGWRGSVDDALDFANAALSPEADGGQ